MTDRDKGYPFKGYVFTPDGMHDGGVWLNDEEALVGFVSGPVRLGIARKVEVMVCDNLDYAVFHAKDGKVIHDGFGITQ